MKTFYQLCESIEDKIGSFTGDKVQALMARDISQEENLPYSDVRDYFCKGIVNLINKMIKIIYSVKSTEELKRLHEIFPRISFLQHAEWFKKDLTSDSFIKSPVYANLIKQSFVYLFNKYKAWKDWIPYAQETGQDVVEIIQEDIRLQGKIDPLMSEFKQLSKKLFLSGVKDAFRQYIDLDYMKLVRELYSARDVSPYFREQFRHFLPYGDFNSAVKGLDIEKLGSRSQYLLNRIKSSIERQN